MTEWGVSPESIFRGDVAGREALERYRALVKTIGDGIYQLDADDRFVAVNDVIVETTGYARDDLLGEHVTTLFDGDGTTLERELDRLRTASVERSDRLETTVRTVDGTGVRCDVRLHSLDTADSLQGTVGVVRGIGDRERSDPDALEQPREHDASGIDDSDRDRRRAWEGSDRLRLAVEAADMGTWELDLRTKDAPVRSAQHDRIFGYEEPREDWGFEIFLDHVHPDDREWVEQRFEEAFETGTWEFDCRIVRADGEQRWIDARGEFHYDGDGEPVRAVGVVRDVTEQKERERYLRRAKSQLEAATEAGAIGTWEWHVPEDRMVAGATFAKTFGLDPSATRKGVSLDRFVSAIHEDDRERVEREIEAALESCGRYEAEYRVRNADGEVRWVVARGHVECDDEGDPITFPGALVDVTERKEYERKLEASNERLEQFAYTASHDLQEPLRMVTSYLQLLESRYADDLDGDAEEFIDYAVDGAERMRDMIDGLLAYSRVETRGDPFEPVDLDAVCDAVLEDLQLQIEETDAEITVDSLPRVEGDPSQLRQVFQNLLSNAIMYSGDEPPRVHVDASRRGDEWILSVSDEGVGIDSGDQERVFEVFERLHAAGKHSGTGIGLALCKRIVERHGVRANSVRPGSTDERSESVGGDIWVESEPGAGATFSFTLSAASDDETTD